MDKVDSMKEQIVNVSREMKILRKTQNKMLQIQNTVRGVKNAFEVFLVDCTWRKESLS